MSVTDEEYQKEYDKAAAELEAAAQATTARGPDGKFAKAEPEKAPEPEAKPEGTTEQQPAKEEEKDPIKVLEERVAKAEKIAKDNQAWATRLAQERAQEKRDREAAERAASKPAILDANPELADAIRYVAQDPAQQNKQVDQQNAWKTAVETAHPGIFDKSIDPELEKAVLKRFEALGEAVQDPLVVIREITEEKLAFAERQVGKRFAAEAAKQAKVSAMAVPGAGAGGGSRASTDSQLAEVQRIQNMSDAEFAREVKRVKGY